MARRRRRPNQVEERDAPRPSLTPLVVPRTDVRAVTDSRIFHPARHLQRQGFFHGDDRHVPHRSLVSAVPALRKTVAKRRPRLVSKKVSPRRSRLVAPPVWNRFAAPARVGVCVRRFVRREVLFALGRSGKGRRPRKNRRFNESSFVRC